MMLPSKSTISPIRVVLSGDNCLNIVLQIPKSLQRGANIDIIHTLRRPGGNALVTAMALSRWGIQTSFFGVIGPDFEGTELLSWMHVTGVDTNGVIVRNIDTRIAYAIINDVERTVLDTRNLSENSGELQPEDWKRTPHMERAICEADAVLLDRYCSGIHDLVKKVISARQDTGKRPILAYRTGTRASEAFQVEGKILPAVDIAFTKGIFLQQTVALSSHPMEACRAFSHRFGIPIVVATLGEDGAAYYDSRNGENDIVPAMPIGRATTTLGAGDFFRAGFLLAYLEDKPIHESVRYGNAAAALHCGRIEAGDPFSMFFPRSESERIVGASDIRVDQVQAHRLSSKLGKIFLSHHKDSDEQIVTEFDKGLRDRGFDPWFDNWGIIPGDLLTEKVSRGLSEMDIFVVFLSPESVRAPWVKAELSSAFSKMARGEVKIIPIRLRQCDIPSILQGIKYIDYEATGLQKSIQSLVDAINEHRHRFDLTGKHD